MKHCTLTVALATALAFAAHAQVTPDLFKNIERGPVGMGGRAHAANEF